MMSHKKLRVFILSCIATFSFTACSPHNIQSGQSLDNPDNGDDFFNLLDPEITNEEQAFAKGEALYNQGKWENALFYYIKTLQFNKNNVKALERIAAIHTRTNHPELAIKAYKEILAIDKNNVTANETLGLDALKNGQNGKAKQYLSTVVKYNNNSWKAHNGLGVLADIEHDSEEAIAHYESALEIEPNSPMLLNNLGYSYYLAGNSVKAKTLFNQALNFDNKYKRAIHNLALIEIKNGNFTTATSLFNRIMPAYDSYNNIGYICMLNGQYAAAEEFLRRAIDESPVYFPKAQENLKTLMSLKRSGTMTYEAPPDPASGQETEYDTGTPEAAPPPRSQAPSPPAAEIKPTSMSGKALEKPPAKPAQAAKKAASKPVAKTASISSPAAQRINTGRPVASNKPEKQPKKAETATAEPKPEATAPALAEQQPPPTEAKTAEEPQKIGAASVKNPDQPQAPEQPVEAVPASTDKNTAGTDSSVAENKAQAEQSPPPAPAATPVNREAAAQTAPVVPPTPTAETVSGAASAPAQPAVEQTPETARQDTTNGADSMESKPEVSKTETVSPFMPSVIDDLQNKAVPVQTETLSLDPPKAELPVNPAASKASSSSPQDEAPARQSRETTGEEIQSGGENTGSKTADTPSGTGASTPTDSQNPEIKAAPAEAAPAAPETQKK